MNECKDKGSRSVQQKKADIRGGLLGSEKVMMSWSDEAFSWLLIGKEKSQTMKKKEGRTEGAGVA